MTSDKPPVYRSFLCVGGKPILKLNGFEKLSLGYRITCEACILPSNNLIVSGFFKILASNLYIFQPIG